MAKKKATQEKKRVEIILGADHGGFKLKELIRTWLVKAGYRVVDVGALTLDVSDDYPSYALKVARAVQHDPTERRGIMLCRSGQGMAIMANRFRNVRAAVITTSSGARETRQDNDSNVLSLPADRLSGIQARRIVSTWLSTSFSGAPRHRRRNRLLDRHGELNR